MSKRVRGKAHRAVTDFALINLALTLCAVAIAQAPPPSSFPGEAPPGPPVEIRSFAADAPALDPGESTSLRWEALNTYSIDITPDIGAVATRGSITITPQVTTTYVLTATGYDGTHTNAVTVTVTGTQARRASDEASGPRQIPELPDGKPDLSGLYIGGRAISLIDGGSLLPNAETFRIVRSDDDLGGVNCMPPGVPRASLMPFPLQIVHKPDVIVIMYEAYHLFRIIPIGVAHPDYLPPAWMGHSVAHWEGDTLVVEVRGFNDKTSVADYRHTEDMIVTERYTRTAYDTIAYEAIVEDPNVFAEPVRYAGDMTLHPEWTIGEYVCNENAQDYDELFGE